MRITFLFPSALLLALTSCDQVGPGPSLSHAAAWNMCGPADGPATVVVLANERVQLDEPSFPSVEIMILQSVSAIGGRTWNLNGDSASASYATRLHTEPVTAGTVTITSVDSAKTVRGSLSAHFGSRIIEMDFTAPWLEHSVLCP